MNLLVVGSVALDTIETPFAKASETPGGSALYISISASYFTRSIGLVGVVGDDFPKDVIEDLRSRGIDLKGLQIVDGGKTFRWGGRYHYDMNTRETLFTHLNVFSNFNPTIPSEFKSSSPYFFLSPVSINGLISSIGIGKIVVEFFSDATSDNVCKNLN